MNREVGDSSQKVQLVVRGCRVFFFCDFVSKSNDSYKIKLLVLKIAVLFQYILGLLYFILPYLQHLLPSSHSTLLLAVRHLTGSNITHREGLGVPAQPWQC